MLIHWGFVKGGDFSSYVNKNEYIFYTLKNNNYISFTLNRYSGKLNSSVGHLKDDGKYLIQQFYSCKKATQ